MGTRKTSAFSFIMVNIVNKGILHFLITTGTQLEGEGGRSPWSFLKNWKNVPWFWEKVPIMAFYRLNFSFKLHCRRKKTKFFPAGHFFLCSRWNVCQGALIPRSLPCPDKYLVTHQCYNGLSKNCSTKIIDP